MSVVVCFNSPAEQQIWRQPKSLFAKGLSAANSIPIQGDLVQGHLLCASEEFPLTGSEPVSAIVGCTHAADQMLSDRALFGLDAYDEALAALQLTGSVIQEDVHVQIGSTVSQAIFKARPSLRRAWSRLSIRSIEPINYSIVDLSNPGQRGRTDGIHDASAVLDTIPYSRVFYHAHPGAIITHRAKKYEIVSMTTPPVFAAENYSFRRSLNLAAFVRPTNVRYFTRPLGKTLITIVKQLEVVELREKLPFCASHSAAQNGSADEVDVGRIANTEVHGELQEYPAGKSNSAAAGPTGTKAEGILAFAGCGAVSVKRQVRGYKKLSIVNFSEISRTELSLPPIEYDTFGLYICSDHSSLAHVLGERYGPGVHALSHALLAVAPMFAPGLTRGDVECDHSYYAPTQIILFDARAGGSGCVHRLWTCFFQPKNILDAAIELLKCPSCQLDSRYDGGCPACLHASNCLKFNQHLSRSAAIVIAERMLVRVKATDLYQQNAAINHDEHLTKKENSVDTTPRRKARRTAMQNAKEMHSARGRQFVVSRPSWPLDGQGVREEKG